MSEHVRRFPLAHREHELVLRWRTTAAGPIGSLFLDGERLKVAQDITRWRNGTRSSETTEPRDEFPCFGLVNGLDTLTLEPAPPAGLTGLARLDAARDPARFATSRWILAGGHSASGVVYNSSVTSRRVIRIEIDLEARTASYVETSDFDDG